MPVGLELLGRVWKALSPQQVFTVTVVSITITPFSQVRKTVLHPQRQVLWVQSSGGDMGWDFRQTATDTGQAGEAATEMRAKAVLVTVGHGESKTLRT